MKLGLSYRETLHGVYYSLSRPTDERPLECFLNVTIGDLGAALRQKLGRIEGELTMDGFADRVPVVGTVGFRLLDQKRVPYELSFTANDGGHYRLRGQRELKPAAPAEWLTVLAERFEQTPDSMLGGHTVNRLIANRYAATSQLIVDVVYAFYNARPEAARFFASNNLAMPAALFRAVGGFDEDVFRVASEDRELCDRWRHTGRRMAYVPEAVVFHAHALPLAAFCRQHFSYGRGAWNYHRRRAERGSGRMRDDFRFYPRFFKLVRGPLAQLPHFRRFSILALLALWQAANATGFAYEACRAVIDPAIRAF